MDDFKIRHKEKENSGVSGYENKMKGPWVGGVMRKRLADISNLQQQPVPTVQDSKHQQVLTSDIEHYIEKLEKGNMMLLKILADRNKSIELTQVELQQLRINLQNLQLQNLQLSQSNSQMLAELNVGKDRLKICQHELGCENALLKAMKTETALKMTGQTSKKLLQAEEDTDTSESFQVDEVANNHHKIDRRWRSKAFGTSLKQAAGSTNAPCEEAFDAGGSVSLHDNLDVEGNQTPSGSVKEPPEKESNGIREDSRSPRRMSTGRPLRRAAGKVQSYKEVPLNIKMRREL